MNLERVKALRELMVALDNAADHADMLDLSALADRVQNALDKTEQTEEYKQEREKVLDS